MTDFKNSEEQAFRRYVRDVIRGTEKLTRTEKLITVYLVNLWFHHKNGPKRYIHPSNSQIMKKIKCSKPVVTKCKKKLREMGVLIKIGHQYKGRKLADRYVFDVASGVQNFTSAIPKTLPLPSKETLPCISNVESRFKDYLIQGNIIYLGGGKV